jgi:hypothetical protein
MSVQRVIFKKKAILLNMFIVMQNVYEVRYF